MIASYVSAVAEPTFHRNQVLIVIGDDPHSDFGGELVVRPIVRDGSYRIPREAAVRFLSQCFGMPFAQSHGAVAFQADFKMDASISPRALRKILSADCASASNNCQPSKDSLVVLVLCAMKKSINTDYAA
jgi:hypothetical protein